MNDENLNGPEDEKVRDDNQVAGADSAPATGRGESDAADAADESSDLPVISDEELQNLLADAMDASTASDSPTAADAEAPNEYLDDLLRVQAEYANYRRRTDREKEELSDQVTARVVKQLLPVVDDLARADAAGDLGDGTAMQVIASKLLAAIEKLGVEAYGAAGEAFDPRIHEAIAQLPNPAVESETIADVVELGYRIGAVELRPAKAAVFVPAT